MTWDKWYRQQQGVSRSAIRDDAERDPLGQVNALKDDRPEDYYQNIATIEWPLGPTGNAFAILSSVYPAVVFRDGAHVDAAKEFVRFLVGEGWLAHYLNFSGAAHSAPNLEAARPAILARSDRPPPDGRGDAARVATDAPPLRGSLGRLADTYLVDKEVVWAQAIHRVAADGISPAQAVDEAIARIKQILAE